MAVVVVVVVAVVVVVVAVTVVWVVVTVNVVCVVVAAPFATVTEAATCILPYAPQMAYAVTEAESPVPVHDTDLVAPLSHAFWLSAPTFITMPKPVEYVVESVNV